MPPTGSGLAIYPYRLRALEEVVAEAAKPVQAAGQAPRTIAGIGNHDVDSTLDVAIVGGGPCGLAVAKALCNASPGLKLKVFERTRGLVPTGAGVSLQRNGLKALAALDHEVAKAVQALGRKPQWTVTLGPKGEVSKEQPTPPALADSFFIGWSNLQEVIHNSLPADTEVFNHHLSSLQIDEDNHVALHFKSATAPVKAKIVIGCDGYFSQVRKQWLHSDDPVYGGTVVWRGRLDTVKVPFWDSRLTTDLRSKKVFMVYPGAPGVTVWVFSCPEDQLVEAGLERHYTREVQKQVAETTFSLQAAGGMHSRLDNETAKHRCLTMCKDYPESMRWLMEATPADNMCEHGIFYRPASDYPQEQLGTGPITLAGDAFHAMRPTGQGTNQALEDAVILAGCIARKGPCEEALREYERIRLPRVKKVARASELAGASSYVTDPDEKKAMMDEVAVCQAGLFDYEFEDLRALKVDKPFSMA